MPIRSLAPAATLPRLGVLRKGAPATATGPGEDLDYFRFDTDDPTLAEAFVAVYGPRPRALPARLAYAESARTFSAWREARQPRSHILLHRCDGETCQLWLDGSRYRTDPCPCPGGCRPVGRLELILPELGHLATVTLVTQSWHDIATLQARLQALSEITADLRAVPLVLRRARRAITMPSPRGRSRREAWLVDLEPDPAWVAERLARPPALPADQPVLPSPSAADRLTRLDAWHARAAAIEAVARAVGALDPDAPGLPGRAPPEAAARRAAWLLARLARMLADWPGAPPRDDWPLEQALAIGRDAAAALRAAWRRRRAEALALGLEPARLGLAQDDRAPPEALARDLDTLRRALVDAPF